MPVKDPPAVGRLGRHGDVVQRPRPLVVGQRHRPGDGAGGHPERNRCCCSGVPTSRTIGANWVTVARRGPGATARPSSSTTTAVSRMVSPIPPYSSGTARAGQSRATMEPQSFSGASPVSTTARTTSMGHSFWRNERTESRSSSCSAVNSSSTALPSRPCRLPLGPCPPTRGRRQIRASVPDANVSLGSPCELHAAPFSGKERGWVCPGGRRSEAQARAGGAGGLRRDSGTETEGRSPTLCGAPLAQRQSNGLLIRRFRVRIPRGARVGLTPAL